jgi:hypothetical protein
MAFHGSFPAIILVITGIYIRTPLILATWKSSKIYFGMGDTWIKK